MTNAIFHYLYSVANESELNDFLAGRERGVPLSWPGHFIATELKSGFTGVLWKRGNHVHDPAQPFALVCREEDFRRLFGRMAQVRNDFSPITSWCHVLTPKQFDALHSPVRDADLRGLETAWVGLIIAEAELLSEISISNLRVPACLATQSFGISRASAIWGYHESELSRRFNVVSTVFKNGKNARTEARTSKIRAALQPIWATLNSLTQARTTSSEFLPIVKSLQALQRAREVKDKEEAALFAEPLRHSVPEALTFFHFSDITPEQRLKMFDQLIKSLDGPDSIRAPINRCATTMLAGYLTTVAAGGSPTLSLIDNTSKDWPEIKAWAYVTGGIGERISWTSGFEGLGRLVAKELLRPFRIDDPPTCDFSLDEAQVLIDSKLSDPYVHLRLRQGKLANIALLPGVNVLFPITDNGHADTKPQSVQLPMEIDEIGGPRSLVRMLADAIWPHLRPRVEERIRSMMSGQYGPSSQSSKNKNKREQNSQPSLKERR